MDPEPLTITKKELVNRIATQTKQTKVIVKDILQRFLDEVIDELSSGNRLEFREFGVFEVRERAARTAQNPRTLEKVHVPAKRVVKFKVGRMMRDRICDERPAERAQRLKAEQLAAAKAKGAGSKSGGHPPIPKPPPSNSPF